MYDLTTSTLCNLLEGYFNLSNRDGSYCHYELVIISEHLLGITMIHLLNVMLQLLDSLLAPPAIV
jgi:hypothetical protein